MSEASATKPPSADDRRHGKRQRVLKGALVVFGAHERVFDCQVRNLSDEGAKLILPSTVGIPNTFHLVIRGDQQFAPARLMWRTETEVGIAFTGPWQARGGKG